MHENESPTPFHVVGIAGSLRVGSYNRALLRTAQELQPPLLRIEIRDLADIPLYNEDVERAGAPESVARLRSVVTNADGLLIATPEYNYGVPGVLKNTVDWLSRPPRGSSLNGKPTAIMGASQGMAGTARSQGQLRQSFVFTNTPAMLKPEVFVAHVRDKFDAAGQLTDDATRDFLVVFLNQFVAWMTRFSPAGRAALHC